MSEFTLNLKMPVLSVTQEQIDALSDKDKESVKALMHNLRKQSIKEMLKELTQEELLFLNQEVSNKLEDV